MPILKLRSAVRLFLITGISDNRSAAGCVTKFLSCGALSPAYLVCLFLLYLPSLFTFRSHTQNDWCILILWAGRIHVYQIQIKSHHYKPAPLLAEQPLRLYAQDYQSLVMFINKAKAKITLEPRNASVNLIKMRDRDTACNDTLERQAITSFKGCQAGKVSHFSFARILK